MSKEKLTDWFQPGINPVHIGVYEVEPDANSPWYSFWDGLYFREVRETVDDAASAIPDSWNHIELTWRGLAEKP